jgi:hypothetical protein
MVVLCLGCHLPLPVRPTGVGRPARYHGSACRQRARRARLATAPGVADLLAAVDRAEQAAAAVRRAITTGANTESAVADLLTAAGALADLASPETATHLALVTESVTKEAARPQPSPTRPPSVDVTEKVTKKSTQRPHAEFTQPQGKAASPVRSQPRGCPGTRGS